MQSIDVKKTQTHPWAYLRLGDSYLNLILGILVVLLAGLSGFLLTLNVLKSQIRTAPHNLREVTSARTKLSPSEIIKRQEEAAHIYTVQKGDSLWSIAQVQLHSGYRWGEIVEKNHLENPGLIFSGMKLQIPVTIAKMETLPTLTNKAPSRAIAKTLPNAPNTVSNPAVMPNDTYTVVSDDNLWNIAVAKYNNGFKWVDIAQANHLANPRIIHSGNILIIPR